jgi:hypothetical protein
MEYQMHCPNCHYEWAYDNGYYDKNIARLGVEIYDIMHQIAEHKKLPKKEQYARTEWWRSAKSALFEKQRELAGLRALRKNCDQQIKAMEYSAFKNAVKERYGEAAYKELFEKVEKEVEAYKISGLMRHEYSRSSAKSDVTSINKI